MRCDDDGWVRRTRVLPRFLKRLGKVCSLTGQRGLGRFQQQQQAHVMTGGTAHIGANKLCTVHIVAAHIALVQKQ